MSSTVETLYRVTPRTAYQMIIEILEAGLVPFLKSSPGMGKSSIMRAVCNYLNLWLIDHRLSTSEPTDISGLPDFKDGSAYFAPFRELFPLKDAKLPKGKDGWMIFFDEFNSSKRDMQAAAYKPILDRMVGQHELHSNVVLTCAGNLETDRAITTQIGTAMQSRVIHLIMEVSFQEWYEDVAIKEGYDSRIMAFLNAYNGYLMDFRPDHTNSTFCCPRTWEFMNRLIQGKDVTDSRIPLYAGTITADVAVKFASFVKVYKNLVTARDIINNPDTINVPDNSEARWAVLTQMLDKLDEKTFKPFGTYVNRFELAFRIQFFRSVLVKNPDLRHHPDFAPLVREITRYLGN